MKNDSHQKSSSQKIDNHTSIGQHHSNGKNQYQKPIVNQYGLLRDITMAPTIRVPQESGFSSPSPFGVRI